MERWLVTGANGFLGSRIMKFYQGKYEITGAHHENLDITDEAAAAEFVRAAAPQLVTARPSPTPGRARKIRACRRRSM